METKDLSGYSDAEKIVLAEQLWDSVSKKDLAVTEETQQELEQRLERLDNGKSQLYTWDEVKNYLRQKR
ncbi:MAG: addiction module protein [Flavobacterium sp. BFFFF1]|uniref:addiction module protein n=1 Tax=Flavobacterium sp. BFFFF1 TaxID=2015557 RepID=UPI000BCD1566|nr:addiction module protein [Flavobacterium sp. BFFFF1]OYU81461.1 MAG: addiction module protein [Flavobacterium sp. BFFFF1]